jgi:hypothetical protein
MLRAFAWQLLAFAPRIAFLLLAHGSLFRVKLAFLIALALSVATGFARLHRGIILWVGLVFFTGGAWPTILAKRPFTLDYGKAHTEARRDASRAGVL